MFSWCFLGVSCFFLAFFDIWAKNRIFWAENSVFKYFLKASKHVYVVFSECFMAFLALFDIWAENRIFEPSTVFLQIS